MFNNDGRRKVVRWLIVTAGGVLLGVLTGLLINWQVALIATLTYFCVGWAAERGQKQKKEIDAYREQWLSKRRSNGDELGKDEA